MRLHLWRNVSREGAGKSRVLIHGDSPGAQCTRPRRVNSGLSQRVIPGHDFREGVRALLVDKDMSPKWAPPTLAAVTDEQIDGVFAPLPGGDLTFPD